MQLEGKAGLSILQACDAARVSRAGFYRHFDEHLPRQADTELRRQIQQICLDNRCYRSQYLGGWLPSREKPWALVPRLGQVNALNVPEFSRW